MSWDRRGTQPDDTRRRRSALIRIIETPQLVQAVARLPAGVLHRAIDDSGLEDAAELVALTTPEQLSALFDLDLWRSRSAGVDEEFDARRFGTWLEVLAEGGAGCAADKLAGVDPGLLIVAVSQYASVFDPAAYTSAADSAHAHLGGYVVTAKSALAWDALVAVLTAMEERHREAFDRLMRGCRRLSDSLIVTAAVCASVLWTASGSAQAPVDAVAQLAELQKARHVELLDEWRSQKTLMVELAAAMPADKFNYRATPPQRTYAEQILHVAVGNVVVLQSLGTRRTPPFAVTLDFKKPAEAWVEASSREEVLKLLTDSYDYGAAVLAELSSQALFATVRDPRGSPATVGTVISMLLSHGHDIYGQMVVYVRLNGIVPPASRSNSFIP